MLRSPCLLRRLTYNMILNLLRVEDLRVEDMMRQSFSEAALQRETSGQREELESDQAQLEVLQRTAPRDAAIAETLEGLRQVVPLLEQSVVSGQELDLGYVAGAMKCIKDGFKCTDKNFLNIAKRRKLKAGSTALVAIVNGDSKFVVVV